jgi:hypothetical protein
LHTCIGAIDEIRRWSLSEEVVIIPLLETHGHLTCTEVQKLLVNRVICIMAKGSASFRFGQIPSFLINESTLETPDMFKEVLICASIVIV